MTPREQRRPRLLMIGLDAADPVVVEQWIDDGTLPHLAALRRKGTSGRLRSSAGYLGGSPWPTFYTSQHPTGHGLYADFQWRHEHMEFAAANTTWINPQPFWRQLDDPIDVVVYDVPFALSPSGFRGAEVCSWATHDKLEPARSHPSALVGEIRARFGEWRISYEGYGPSGIDELLALREEMLENTRRSAELARWLLERPWQLAIICFSTLHRGGHRLWDRTSVKGPISETQGALFDGAIKDLYMACDRAVGDLVADHPDADIVVFSVHGMMPNTARVDLLDGMLARVLSGDASAAPPVSLSRRLGAMLPQEWLRFITRNIPARLQNVLMTAWTSGAIDWSDTQAFTCRADLHGYIRVNLAGREPRGVVEPGAEYGALCDRIAEGLASFRDADTGEPFIAEVRRVEEVFPPGPQRDRLPDILVVWADTPSAPHRAVESPRFGTVARKVPGRVPSGRSANHRGEGFIIARGDGIAADARLADTPHIIDLAPTALARLNVRCRAPLAGRVITDLAPAPAVVA